MATAYQRSRTTHPRAGWDEQDGDALLEAIQSTLGQAVAHAGDVILAAVGLANQGESVIAFDRVTGRPLSPAILWSDRRGSELVQEVTDSGAKELQAFRLPSGPPRRRP